MIRRLAAVWHARNLEFLRDRSTMIFTLLLPIMLVVGMGFVFGGKERPLFKVGVIAASIDKQAHPFLRERYVEFVPITDEAQGLQKVTHQQIDLLLDLHGAAALLGQHRLAQGLHHREAAASSRAGRASSAGDRCRSTLRRLPLSRHSRA